MASFSCDDTPNIVWNKDLVCENQIGNCSQYYFDKDTQEFVKSGEYSKLTDYALDIVASNVKYMIQ